MTANENNLPDDESLLEISADDLLDNALIDYAESFDEDKRNELLQRLETQEDFYLAMSNALNRMAMLIAAAAVLDDNAEFSKRRRLVLFEARNDIPEVKQLRLHYLKNRNAVDMERLLRGEEDKKRFDQRLESFMEDYLQLHPGS